MRPNNGDDLHEAIVAGDLESVRRLVRGDAMVNYSLSRRGSAVCAAISANHPKVLDFLLSINSDTTTLSPEGHTPLTLAICNQLDDCVRILIKSGKCNKNLVDRVTFNPPICDAIYYGGQFNIVQWLVQAKCDINKAGKSGLTPLHCAILKRNEKIIKILLASPSIDVNKYDSSGRGPIHLAAACPDSSVLETLLRNYPLKVPSDGIMDDPLGLDIHKGTQEEGNTALHIAIQSEIDECIGLLLEAGSDVNAQNLEGATPLFLASHTPRMDYIIPLMESGADPDILCRPRVAAVANTHQVDVSCAHVAILRNNYLLLRRLAIRGANLNIKNELGHSTLHLALIKNRTDIALYLLSLAKEDRHLVDVNSTDKNLNTPLFFIGYCHEFIPQIVNKLVKLGADVNHANSHGKSPIHAAMDLDNKDVLHMLLQNGADANARFDGRTPLQVCAFEGQEELALKLVAAGADMNAVTQEGETALRIALENNALGVVKVLLGCGYNVSREGFSEDAAEADKLPFYLRDATHIHLRNLIFSHANNAISLGIQSRNMIRRHVRQCKPSDCTLNSQLKLLPLPKRLKEYMLMKAV